MRTFVLVILALCALVLGLKTFPGAVGSDHVLRAGRWVAENCPPGEDGKLRLMTAADSRIGFYAGAADRQFPLDWIARFHKGHYKEPLSVDIILTWAKRQKPPLRRLIVQKEELDEYAPGLLEKLDADSRFRRLVRIDNEDNDDEEAVIVYEILYERPPLPSDEERP